VAKFLDMIILNFGQTLVAQQSLAKIIHLIIATLVTSKAAAKSELAFDKPQEMH